jgi:signal transduction histidine kinase
MQQMAVSPHETTELAAAFLQTGITFGLVMVCGYLYARYRKPYFALWALAWCLYSLRLVVIIVFLVTQLWGLLYWHQVLTGWTALTFLWSALVFSQRLRWHRAYWVLVLFPPVWSYIAIYQLESFMLAAGPAVVFLSLATLWTGVILWRHHRQIGSVPAALMAGAFFLWSLHHLDYPFLRARGAWNPWGYYLDIVFELAIGAAILLLVVEDQYRGLSVLSSLSADLQSGRDEDGVLKALLARPLTLPGVRGSAMYLVSTGTVVRGLGACTAWEDSSPTGKAREAIGRVIDSGQPEVMRGWSEVLADETHPYVAALPVFLGEEVRGALLVAGSAQDPLTVLDNRFLVALGHQVGGALANADLMQRLEDRTRDLERLAARMVEQHEEERRRLSRELHDESAQVFAAVKLQLGLLRESATREQGPALDRALDLVGSGIRSIREVARGLRPSLLDDLGLQPALQALADDFESKTGIETVLAVHGPLPALAPESELALFRTMQEGLSNVARHSGATSVTVTLARRDGELVLTVRDDGKGLGEGRPAEEQLRSRTGVLGMRERVATLGGSVELSDPEEGGAELVVRLPTAAAGGRGAIQDSRVEPPRHTEAG